MTTRTIDQIIVRTHADGVMTRSNALQIIEHVQRLLTHDIPWIDVVDLCSIGHPATLTDAVQYTIDCLNDECPSGYWYYLTADANLALHCEDDS